MARAQQVLSLEKPLCAELPIAFTTTALSSLAFASAAAVASAAVASTTALVSVAAASSSQACCAAQKPAHDDFDDDASTIAGSELDCDEKGPSRVCWADLMDFDDEEFQVEVAIQGELHNQVEGECKPESGQKKSTKASWADLADNESEDDEPVFRTSSSEVRSLVKAAAESAPTQIKSQSNMEVACVDTLDSMKREQATQDGQRLRQKKTTKVTKPATQQNRNSNTPQSQFPSSDTSRNAGREQRDRCNSNTAKGKGKGAKGKGKGAKGSGKGAIAKLQCQFTVGIEDDSKFRIVRRIIGQGGENMKRIAEESGAKLRLRGRGSKFLEGLEQQESMDDLMLCVSGQDKAGFEHAKGLVSELLRNIYHSYDVFCQKAGKTPLALGVQVNEGYREGSR